MDMFPKVLQLALTELLSKENIVQWNINSNGNVTSVHIRFAPQGHIVNSTPYSQSGVRKSPSQQTRDHQRFQGWTSDLKDSNNGYSPCVVKTSNESEQVGAFCAGSKIDDHIPMLTTMHGQGHFESNQAESINIMPCADMQCQSDREPDKDNETSESMITVDEPDLSEDFEKIVADFRGCVRHTVILGLTKEDGAIVKYETVTEKFEVLPKNDDNMEYCQAKGLINEFNDIRVYIHHWRSEVNEMYKHWQNHKMK